MASSFNPKLYEAICEITDPSFSERLKNVCITLGVNSLEAIRGVSSGPASDFWKITAPFLENSDFKDSEDFVVIENSLIELWEKAGELEVEAPKFEILWEDSSENYSQGSTEVLSSQDVGEETEGKGVVKKEYIRRSIFLKGQKPKKCLKGPKEVSQTRVDNKDLTFDILFLVGTFEWESPLLASFRENGTPNDIIREFVLDAFQKRCRTVKSINGIADLVLDFLEFAKKLSPPGAIHGLGATPTISMWLKSLIIRGQTVPHRGRYALTVISEVFGLDWRLNHPAVIRNSRATRRRVVRQAPFVPFELASKFEATAADVRAPLGIRLACSYMTLMLLASLRFSDLRQVSEFWLSDTAVCGRSVNQKDKEGSLMVWATPIGGLTGGGWFKPLLQFWQSLRKASPLTEFLYLTPAISNRWVVLPKIGTNGISQAVLNRVLEYFGSDVKLKLHSFRAWFPTCANQLAIPREGRATLGRWAAGSVMPDRYDRNACVSELNIRQSILEKMNEGWRPSESFEVQTKGKKVKKEVDSSEASDTSETSLEASEEDISKL